MTEIKIKGLSVNECFKGRRFKTDSYKTYEYSCMFMLPKMVMPLGELKISLEFGVSNSGSDIDNFLKPFLDILQKKYGINDNQIWELNAKKTKCKKGDEFIRFHIESNI